MLELFLRCANDVTNINRDKMFKKTVRFSDEPPDAFLYEARNVWSMIDQVEVKLNVPFMNNNCKCATFTAFFGKIVKITSGRGLTHREILDLIRDAVILLVEKEFPIKHVALRHSEKF